MTTRSAAGAAGASAALLCLALAAIPAALEAQTPRRSQRGGVTQRIASTEVTLDYSRPVARGRELFGGVVKWGETWNPGADSASTIRFSRDVVVAGSDLPAGLYSIWAIPRPAPEAWTLILSRAAPVFHVPYPKGRDALRFDVRPVEGSHMETLAFYFPVVEGHQAVLHLHWGTTIIPIPIIAP